jgi:DNA mismatch endonuclease (patch repair protein)
MARSSAKVPRFVRLKPASPTASKAKQSDPAKGTLAETLLRWRLWAHELRYRVHAKDLPGKPDIVFRRQRLVVFVDGDFWHGRDWPSRVERLERGTNPAYWIAKIAYNMERDRTHNDQLRASGWTVIRFWETDALRTPDQAAGRIIECLSAPAALQETGPPGDGGISGAGSP